jgi:hypothetical protein
MGLCLVLAKSRASRPQQHERRCPFLEEGFGRPFRRLKFLQARMADLALDLAGQNRVVDTLPFHPHEELDVKLVVLEFFMKAD